MTRQRILFDTDPGVDDAMALLFLEAAPQVELVGITTAVGNHSVQTTTRNALYICQRFGIDAPVHMGAAQALVVEPEAHPTFVHGDDGLGNIHADTPPLSGAGADAAGFIVERVLMEPNELTIVAVGRLTNLALALQMEPRIAGLVKEVVIMGGALGSNQHTGNVTPVAEANIYGDPHAADMVFTAGWPVVLVGLDVTMNCVLHSDRMRALCQRTADAGRFIWDISRHYETYYRERRGVNGIAVHDACAAAFALAPDLFETVSGPIRAATEGISRGQTIIVPGDRKFPPTPGMMCPMVGGASVSMPKRYCVYTRICS